MNKEIIECCKNPVKFIITYEVAGEQKRYSVCESCADLECFSKHIIKKEDYTADAAAAVVDTS